MAQSVPGQWGRIQRGVVGDGLEVRDPDRGGQWRGQQGVFEVGVGRARHQVGSTSSSGKRFHRAGGNSPPATPSSLRWECALTTIGPVALLLRPGRPVGPRPSPIVGRPEVDHSAQPLPSRRRHEH